MTTGTRVLVATGVTLAIGVIVVALVNQIIPGV